MYGREYLCRAVQLPEDEHGDEEQDGTPRAVVQHAMMNRGAPEDRHDEGADEDDKTSVRLCRRKEGAFLNLRMVACIRCTEPVQEIGRQCAGRYSTGGDGRIARCRQTLGQGIGERDGRS